MLDVIKRDYSIVQPYYIILLYFCHQQSLPKSATKQPRYFLKTV